MMGPIIMDPARILVEPDTPDFVPLLVQPVLSVWHFLFSLV